MTTSRGQVAFPCPECKRLVTLGDIECPWCQWYLGAETWEDYR